MCIRDSFIRHHIFYAMEEPLFSWHCSFKPLLLVYLPSGCVQSIQSIFLSILYNSVEFSILLHSFEHIFLAYFLHPVWYSFHPHISFSISILLLFVHVSDPRNKILHRNHFTSLWLMSKGGCSITVKRQ